MVALAQRDDGQRPGKDPAAPIMLVSVSDGSHGSEGSERSDGFDASTLRVEGPLTVRSLSRIRRAITGQAGTWRLNEPMVDAVQTVSSELAANIIVHAHGDGRLIFTQRPGAFYCQAIDRGPGMPLPFLAGWQAPASGDPAAARGLWMVRMLSARVQIDSSILGTTVTAVLVWR